MAEMLGPGIRSASVANDVLIPILLILAMWFFGFYVLSVREALYSYGGQVLQFVYFFFVIATVLIAKMRSIKGNAGLSMPYVVALAVVVWLFVTKFTLTAGGIAGSLSFPLALLTNYALFGGAWYAINWISRDCTVDPDTEETATGSMFDPVPRDRRRPGRSVAVSSLVAAVVFGAGQLALSRGAREAYHLGYLCAGGFAATALMLLALTNLSGLSLYLSSRKLRMPAAMSVYWLGASAMLVAAAVALSWIAPRPGGHAGESIVARDFGRDGGRSALPEGPASGTSEAEAPPSGRTDPGGQPGRARPSDQGEGASVEGPENGPQPTPGESGTRTIEGGGAEPGEGEPGPGDEANEEPSDAGERPGGDAEKPDASGESGTSGEESSRHGQGEESAGSEPRGAPEPREESGAPESAAESGTERRREESSPTESSARDAEGPESQAAAGESGASDARGPAEPPPPQAAPPDLAVLADLARPLAIILGVLAGLAVLAFLVRAFLKGVRPRLALPRLPRLFRRDGRPPEFRNPFADADGLHDLSPRDVVLHTYGAFMSLARICGCPRPPQKTASEFLSDLPSNLAGLRDEARELSRMYLQAEYATDHDFTDDLPRLGEIWGRLEAHLSAWLGEAQPS